MFYSSDFCSFLTRTTSHIKHCTLFRFFFSIDIPVSITKNCMQPRTAFTVYVKRLPLLHYLEICILSEIGHTSSCAIHKPLAKRCQPYYECKIACSSCVTENYYLASLQQYIVRYFAEGTFLINQV